MRPVRLRVPRGCRHIPCGPPDADAHSERPGRSAADRLDPGVGRRTNVARPARHLGRADLLSLLAHTALLGPSARDRHLHRAVSMVVGESGSRLQHRLSRLVRAVGRRHVRARPASDGPPGRRHRRVADLRLPAVSRVAPVTSSMAHDRMAPAQRLGAAPVTSAPALLATCSLAQCSFCCSR